ncbi:MAG TPA: LPS assembly lipoprotein LptE [Candidatus Angelobacter sp.]|nr:LPS assembly lipoprotein LptE [Candidatus Angelobacter sp.]
MRGETQLDEWINGLMDKFRPSIHSSIYPFILLSACLTLLAGCGYTLGPTNGLAAGEKKIQITPFRNHTLEPRLGDAVTTALREDIQRDGTYRLATRGGADIIVTGEVTKYERHELNFVPHDVLTVQDYRVTAFARITARNLATGTSTNWTASAYTLVRVGSDLTSSERQAMPILADALAKNVTDSLVNGSW